MSDGRSASLGRTVRGHWADGVLPMGGWSVNRNRTTRCTLQHTDGPYLVHRWSASNWCRADGPRRPGGRSAKLQSTKQLAKQIEMKTLKNTRRTRRTLGQLAPRGLSALTRRTFRQVRTGAGTATREQTREHPTTILPWISQTA
jgi:hypothetical protein